MSRAAGTTSHQLVFGTAIILVCSIGIGLGSYRSGNASSEDLADVTPCVKESFASTPGTISRSDLSAAKDYCAKVADRTEQDRAMAEH